MSLLNSHTTADYIPWETATNLVRKLYRDKNYRMSLYIGTGIFFGLRASDLLKLTWEQILGGDELVIVEKKTGKVRKIHINKEFQSHAKECFKAMNILDSHQYCFLNKFGKPISIQSINMELKAIKVKYQIKIDHISSHSLRKTFSRAIWERENSEGRGEMALVKLSEMLNHSTPAITRRYIGLRQQELACIYDSLNF